MGGVVVQGRERVEADAVALLERATGEGPDLGPVRCADEASC